MQLIYAINIEELKQYRSTLRKKREQDIQYQLKTIEEAVNLNNICNNWNYLHKKRHEQAAIQNGENHFEQLHSEIKMNPDQT